MSERSIFDQVCARLRSDWQLPADRILTRETAIVDELPADSLDVVELTMWAEDEWGVEIEDNDLGRIRTVGDLVAIVESKTGHP
jgi:acyl carrier protein